MITLNSNINSERLSEIKNLYIISFPKSERKPFNVILNICKKGYGELFSIENEGEFVGLASMIIYNDIVLLDYFAISPQKQNCGFGSAALELLKKHYCNKCFILEIESTLSYGIDKAELEKRVKRKRFYEKSGFSSMNYLIDLFGVEMEIMTCNFTVSFEEYHNIFTNIFPENIARNIKKVL